MKQLEYRPLYTPIASYLGLSGLGFGAYFITTGTPATWLIASLIGIFFIQMSVTVGFHRLFCHQAFKTSQTWETLLAVLATLTFYGSTIQWSGLHAAHHKYSDTQRDPHFTGWSYLLWKRNANDNVELRVISRISKSKLHSFLHRNYLLPFLLLLIVGVFNPTFFIFGYLIPLGWLHLVNGLHQVLAHNKQGPRDLGLLELPLFTGGEWYHAYHHKHPRASRFGTLDLGYLFIRLIRKG